MKGDIGLYLNRISMIKGQVKPPNRQKKFESPIAVTLRCVGKISEV